MNIKTLVLGIAVSGLGIADAHATPTDMTFNGSAGGVKVKSLNSGTDTVATLNFTKADGTDLTCGATNTAFNISRSHAAYDSMNKTTMLAFLTGRTLNVVWENISNVCYLKIVSTS